MNYRVDLFAIFIFLGIVQAVFLSFFFLSKENRRNQTNVFQGIFILALACVITEIFLMYSGYIVHVFYLVDFSESISFTLGPLVYLMVLSLIKGKVQPRHYLHFIPFVLYSFYLLLFLTEPESIKYNSWINAYHPDWPERDAVVTHPWDPWHIKRHITDIILTHVFIYLILCLYRTVNAFRLKKESFLRPVTPALRSLRDGVVQFAIVLITVLAVKASHYNDTGDHLYAIMISLQIYVIGFSVMRHSGFFKQTPLTEQQQKYKSSSLTDEQFQNILNRLKELMEKEKPFLRPDFSLPDLATKLRVTVHQLSQVINDGLNKSFFEMTAEYRVVEAKRLLKDHPNIKVEEIAEQVGYNSKSSFNTSFKKLSGMTPSEFRSKG